MPIAQFVQELQALTEEAQTAFAKAADADQLDEARVEFLGAKKGRLKVVQKGLGGIDKSDKPAAGQALNATKTAIQAAFEQAKARLLGDEDTVVRD